MPARIAEGKGEPAIPPAPSSATSAAAAKAPGSVASPQSSGSAAASTSPLAPSTAPDPTPLSFAEQVEYEFELRDGEVHVLSVKPVKLAQAIVTPRRVGRYAVELSIGHELIDRVRFDFPATAADEPQLGKKIPLHAPISMTERAIAQVKVLVPHSPRVRRALLVDRARQSATELEWPLPPPPAARGGAPHP